MCSPAEAGGLFSCHSSPPPTILAGPILCACRLKLRGHYLPREHSSYGRHRPTTGLLITQFQIMKMQCRRSGHAFTRGFATERNQGRKMQDMKNVTEQINMSPILSPLQVFLSFLSNKLFRSSCSPCLRIYSLSFQSLEPFFILLFVFFILAVHRTFRTLTLEGLEA